MATRIRLRRVGRKKLPLYRIVVAEKTAPRDGRFIDVIGTYSPKAKLVKDQITVDADKARAWLAKGATAVGDGQLAAPEGRACSSSRRPDDRRRPPPGGRAVPQAARTEGRVHHLPPHRRPGPGLRAGAGVAGGGSRGRGDGAAAHDRAEPAVPPRVAAEVRGTRPPGRRSRPYRSGFLAVPAVRGDAAGRGRGVPPRARRLRRAARGRHAGRAGDRRQYEMPNGLVIEVQGPKREFLLPYRKEFVSRWTARRRRLVIAPPDGLLDG